MTYADPTVTEAVSSGSYQDPRPLVIAQNTIAQAATHGLQAPNAQMAATGVADCSTLTFPSNIVVKEAGAASPGGTVPATYTMVSLTGDHRDDRYRVLVQDRWNAQTRWVDPVVTHIERYDGPWPPDPTQTCQTPQLTPRFKPLRPEPMLHYPRPSDPTNSETPVSTTADPVPAGSDPITARTNRCADTTRRASPIAGLRIGGICAFVLHLGPRAPRIAG